MWLPHKPRMIFHLSVLLLVTTTVNAHLEEVVAWRLLTFQPPVGFPGASPYGLPVTAPKAVFTGLQADSDRFFVSIPRLHNNGNPITLGWVPRPPPGHRLPLDTPINAFPDWDWHWAAANGAASAATNCSALVSVFRTRLDDCGRLWVLDTGVVDNFATFTQACPPKILIFKPSTGRLLRRIDIPPKVLKVNSLLTTMILDTRRPQSPKGAGASSHCAQPDFVYIADPKASAIIVYDVRADDAWRLSDLPMLPEPDKGTYKVAGESFKLMDGIIGLALSNPVRIAKCKPHKVYTERYLYFHAFASQRTYSLATSFLRSHPDGGREDADNLPIKLVGRRSSQSTSLEVDPRDNSILYSPVSETAIVSWKPAQNKFIVRAYNPILLQCVLQIDVESDDIFFISTRLQKFIRGTINAKEVNLRILRLGTTPKY